MSYQIMNEDLRLSLQHNMILRLLLQVYDLDGNIINEIKGDIVSGTESISADSDVRRTFSLEVIPNKKSRMILQSDGYIWLDKVVWVYIGMLNRKTGEDKWWKQGKYLFTTTSASYDATNNTLSLSLSDMMAWLDGTRNGLLGQQIISIPSGEEMFLTSYITEAQADGVDVSNQTAMYVWLDNHYPTTLTSCSNDVKTAAYQLVYNAATLTQVQQDNYLVTVKTEIPLATYMYDGEVAQLLKPYIIRESIIKTYRQLGRLKECNVDHVGEWNGMPQYNDDYETYRNEHPEWDKIPYDLEFSSGASVSSILRELVDLYPNYEMYFDEESVFCVNMIPSCYSDDITLEDDFMQKVLISESSQVDFSEVKNIQELWCSSLDTEFYAQEGVTLDGTTFKATIDGYDEKYYNGDYIALKLPANNPSNSSININNLGDVIIWDDNENKNLDADKLKAGQTYVFKINIKHDIYTHTDTIKAIFCGHFQLHAMAVLVDSEEGNTDDMYTTTSGTTVARYSKQYFEDVYNCENVFLYVCPSSPYTVQKIGEILNVSSGDEYEAIDTVPKAMARARYDLWKSATLTDNITVSTKICPWMDVNKKVRFISHCFDLNDSHQYIVKSLSHDFAGGTTSWTLMRYYPMYEPGVVDDNDSNFSV